MKTGKHSTGLSIVLCFYNARKLLGTTLEHLEKLELDPDLPFELVCVDNNSTDGSAEFIRSNYQGRAELVILQEPRQGISWARRTGLKACRYAFIATVDDDNWVDPDWAEKGISFMQAHPDAGGVGSLNRAVSDEPLPFWFDTYQANYAVGPYKNLSSEVGGLGQIWSAGCFLRKSAVDQALALGTDPLTPGRKGGGLLSGDDTENFMLMQLCGWKFYASPEIRISHYMPAQRLTWSYFLRFKEGIGRTIVYMDMYRRLIDELLFGKEPRLYDWQKEKRRAFKRLLNNWPGLLRHYLPGSEGNHRVVQARTAWGGYAERREKGAKLEEMYKNLRAQVIQQLPSRAKTDRS